MSEIIQDLSLEDVIGDRFGRYSKYIIQERALPDVRDGLKPVQRRILFAMHSSGNTYDKNFRKSAKTVGDVIGQYHPHGDLSVYDAMVRLSQDWKLRHVLIEMHGNNGSIDNDPPAAMRYTEAKLSQLSEELVRDINKETVAFVPNYDDTTLEPMVLPARFPNLLVNGSTGISSGYATDIPPHNLAEVIQATLKYIDNPDITVTQLMKYIKVQISLLAVLFKVWMALRKLMRLVKVKLLYVLKWMKKPFVMVVNNLSLLRFLTK